MKNLLLTLAVLSSLSTMASSELTGEFTLNSGDSSCEKNVSLIDVQDGLRLVATNSVGTMFEDETAEDFLSINGDSVTSKSSSSSHGTKYVSESSTTFDGMFLTKKAVLKEYNFGIRTSKTKALVTLEFSVGNLEYSKSLKGSKNWTRECSYSRL